MRVWLIVCGLIALGEQKCWFDECHPVSEEDGVITAHLIPHTHDDLGWIKTVDQYYWGAKPELVPVGVQYIYNTVIDELLKNKDRRFSFAETGFLMRWYRSHNKEEQKKLVDLVKNGQIELIGGGWVQNDEATAHYVDIIDQMTVGLQNLKAIFNECGIPTTGWQIDPFGHSREMANIYAQMGYTSLFFARIHYLEKAMRLQNKTLEFNWKTSDNLDSQIFTGAFFQDNYGPPEGFCWDALCGDDPIMDNPDIEEYNVDQKVEAFIKHVREQASYQHTNQVMLLMGSDFQYTNANSWYTNLDKLFYHVNKNATNKVKVIYSTPGCYAKVAQKRKEPLAEKTDDFFPYASSKHSYWTGYFSSRPTFKGMIRQASSWLQLAKQLNVMIDPRKDSMVEKWKEASGLVQHHDAVTGTAKENVTQDYEKQLSEGMDQLEVVINQYMDSHNPQALNSKLIVCPLLNVTVCPELQSKNSFSIVIFNPNSRYYNGTIKIPEYEIHKDWVIVDSDGEPVKLQESVNVDAPKNLQFTEQAPKEKYFYVSIPPLGYNTFYLKPFSSEKIVKNDAKKNSEDKLYLENSELTVIFDNFGYMKTVYNKKTREEFDIRQEYFYYEGVDSNDTQPSGAYIFRPKSQTPIAVEKPKAVIYGKTSVCNEVRIEVNDWLYQVVRLPHGKNYIEVDWVVGPLLKEDTNPVTKEVVVRFSTTIESDGVFYTDSNGRQAIRRKFGEASSFKYSDDEPISGNYYPITSFGYIRDQKHQFTVLTDRAQGMTSQNGFIEIMLHRRCFYDDHWGVEEALDEKGIGGKGLVAKGTHTLIFSKNEEAANIFRPLAMEKFNAPVIAFSPFQKAAKFRFNRASKATALTSELPPWLHLMTMEQMNGWTLLRFEHIIHSGDGSDYPKTGTFNIMTMFKDLLVDEISEMTLGGNIMKLSKNGLMDIKIQPSEILTFRVRFLRK